MSVSLFCLILVNHVYASSLNEFVNPLNISQPVCPVMQPNNVCNDSSVSQLIKPLNASKPSVQVMQLNVTSVTSVLLVNSLNH